jgi:acetyl-CoA C-acetyltransferase
MYGLRSFAPPVQPTENLAKDYKITREEADAFAAESHRRAAAAWAEGRFADEVVPVPVPQGKGDPVLVARDEGIRPESTRATLAKLKAIMKEGTVTAGNAAQQNDDDDACFLALSDRSWGRS